MRSSFEALQKKELDGMNETRRPAAQAPAAVQAL